MQNKHPLQIASQEERDRSLLVAEEITTLHAIVQNAIKQAGYTEATINALQEKVMAELTLCSTNTHLLMKHLNEHCASEISFALGSNKNIITFDGAKDIVSTHMLALAFSPLSDTFKMDPNIPTMLGGRDGDIMGTYTPNFLQTALLTMLYVAKDAKSIDELTVLHENNIYQVATSPTLQTVELPGSFKIEGLPVIKDWFYNYNCELLVPTVGYAYGGSRKEIKYDDKAFKNEDCSSFVAKCVGLDPRVTSTWHLKQAYAGTSLSDTGHILKALMPLKNNEIIMPGDIFVRGGHTGFVCKISEMDGKLIQKELSYNRSLPAINYEGDKPTYTHTSTVEMEGLGYSYNPVESAGNMYFRLLVAENNISQVLDV